MRIQELNGNVKMEDKRETNQEYGRTREHAG